MSTGFYREVQKTVEDGRAEDYRRLVELTAALSSAETADKKQRAAAIAANQHFWSALRVAVAARPGHLPESLHLGLIRLADWVERESVLAALGDAPLEGLIAVNRQIMEGLKPLSGNPPPEASTAEDAAPL